MNFSLPTRGNIQLKNHLSFVYSHAIYFFIYLCHNFNLQGFLRVCLHTIALSSSISFKDGNPKTAGKIGQRCAMTILTLKETSILRHD